LFQIVVARHHEIHAAQWGNLLDDCPFIGEIFKTVKTMSLANATKVTPAKRQVAIVVVNQTMVHDGTTSTGTINHILGIGIIAAKDLIEAVDRKLKQEVRCEYAERNPLSK